MEHFFCNQTYIPLRGTPSHKSEQVSQLIYGESAKVIERDMDWLKVKMDFDGYEGWVEEKLATNLVKSSEKRRMCMGFERLIRVSGDSIWLSTGSEVSSDYLENGDFTVATNEELDNLNLIELAAQFIGSPYLWGGRTFLGIDCSGLVQIVFKSFGVNLPRDASQQIEYGENVSFLGHAQAGDLAFFNNKDGNISHVGILIDSSNIIHASGSVRVDPIDQQGIFNKQFNSYTHQLRLIKRLNDW